MEVPPPTQGRRMSVGQAIIISVLTSVFLIGGGLGGWTYNDRRQMRQDLNIAIDRLTSVEQRSVNVQTELVNASNTLSSEITDVKAGLDGLQAQVANINARTPNPKNTNTNTVPVDRSVSSGGMTFGTVKAVDATDYTRGSPVAKLTLIEYSDLECPFCKTFHPTMKQILAEYDGRVRWVYRHYPLSFHQNAQKEAEATLCVGKLGGETKTWDFIDKIYERTTANGTGFALSALGPLANELGIDQTKFQSCLDGGEMAAAVAAQVADGTVGGVSGTPTTLVVNTATGKTLSGIPGAYQLDQVKTMIDQALTSL